MRGQAQIYSYLLVALIIITLIGTVYTWGLPLIRKRQDTGVVERVRSFFDPNNPTSLERRIVFVASNKGEEYFSLDKEGIWILDTTENSISFTFFSRVSNFGVGEWISLSGEDCENIREGSLGERPFVVCARSDPVADGFNITYKIVFRDLVDEDGNTYRIILSGTSSAVSKKGIIRYVKTSTSQKLIETKIEILLG